MSNKKIPKWLPDGSCAEESENKVFCMAPWTHTYISPQGERRLCCARREAVTDSHLTLPTKRDVESMEVPGILI